MLIEKSSHITSGGVSGLSIGIADCLHVSAAFANFCIRAMIFWLVYQFRGKLTAFWTLVGAGITGISMWIIESINVHLDWPQWFALGFILVFSKLPIGLLVSKGYSIGGFTAIAQLLEQHMGISLALSLLFMNLLSVFTMFIAHGFISGFLTALVSLSAGFATSFWSEVSKVVLDKPGSRAPMFR